MLGECAGSALAWLFEPSSANERLGYAFEGVEALVLGGRWALRRGFGTMCERHLVVGHRRFRVLWQRLR